MTKKNVYKCITLVCLIFSIVCCGETLNKHDAPLASATQLGQDKLDTIVLGSVSTRFPAFASSLKEVPSWGFDLAIREANDAGGLLGGKKVIGMTSNEGYYASNVISAAKRMLADQAVAMVVGGDDSICVPVKNVLQDKNRIPAAITNCGAPDITLESYEGLAHTRSPISIKQSPNNMFSSEAQWLLTKCEKFVLIGFETNY